ncbi:MULTISPECIES: tripartite tricarboxylate transporter substrate binding protein [Roseomonadaceae]|uniref:Tripartite tricarboxylate transporter substrate binding protein n=1 Tax=Falsiroseomonas oleicola TaxID=2801474 RepID=A0ABS6H0L2_9PROT|nr:tripartite tricarboxylate transporter substrate binding protein [Roseomonas oleicola]MBU8542207.1 tripartite tricarboxylate transporter substrate binding protein [Roseomonas oleicola]
MQRRLLLAVGAGLLAAPALRAQPAWPARTVRLLVPFIPGSAPDVIARQLAERIGASLGQPMVVENRGGAGGNIGFEAGARAAPDGYTFLLGTNSLVINPALTSRTLGYDAFRDFAPVNVAFAMPHLLIVPSNGPVSTAALIEGLKARPDQNYASGGNGSGAHLAAEMFKASAQVQAVHVPFRGAPDIVNNVMSGQVQFGFPTLATATELVKAGKLKGLAVTSAARNHALPQVPTMAETLPGFDLTSWFALMAPTGTPVDAITRVDAAVRQALEDPAFRARTTADGSIAIGMGPDRFATFLRAEAQKWGEAVRVSGARID